MSDHRERACWRCGSLLHHEDDGRCEARHYIAEVERVTADRDRLAAELARERERVTVCLKCGRAVLLGPPGDAPSVTRPWLQYEREIVAYLFERIERWTADGRKPAQTYFTSGLEREVARMIESAIEPPPGDATVKP